MRKFGIIGKPLAQSPSKSYFDDFFKCKGINAEFKFYEISNLNNFKSFLIEERPEGLLVTIPLKKKVFQFADSFDYQDLQATNMISVSYEADNVNVHAYNTDFLAFKQDLLSINPDLSKPALVIGRGGAAQAVLYALDKVGCKYFSWGRQNTSNGLQWEELSAKNTGEFGLVINTTPLGMAPLEGEFPPLNYSALSPACIAYDLVYKPEKTLFLQKCEEVHCRIRNGSQMLIRIYELALEKWNLL